MGSVLMASACACRNGEARIALKKSAQKTVIITEFARMEIVNVVKCTMGRAVTSVVA